MERRKKTRRAVIGGFEEAWAGIRATVVGQRNMRFHVAVAVAVLALGILLGVSRVEFAVLVLTIALVLAVETINTAIEAVVDLLTEGEHHPLAGLAKDAGAGAVLIASIGAVVIGALIFADEVLSLIASLAGSF